MVDFRVPSGVELDETVQAQEHDIDWRLCLAQDLIDHNSSRSVDFESGNNKRIPGPDDGDWLG